MNVEQLYRDFGIAYVTEGHKHSHPGWVHTPCPFCSGNAGYHLGYDIENRRFVCWRCGWKADLNVIKKVTNTNTQQARELLRKYGAMLGRKTEKKIKIVRHRFRLPPESNPMKKSHKQYLISRGFEPEELAEKWGLLGTGMFSKLDNVNYSRRIIIPYYYAGEVVSFDTRDITGKAQNKYMACSDRREGKPHKHILYGREEKWQEDCGICVEGCTDVWRLGELSFAVSGIKYTPQQVREISKRFRRVAVIFDPEPQARKQANRLVNDLKFRGLDAFRVDIDSDPGDLSQEDADELVRNLKK